MPPLISTFGSIFRRLFLCFERLLNMKYSLDEGNKKELAGVFTTLKVLVLFFCIIPVGQTAFSAVGNELMVDTLVRVMLFLCIIIVVSILWFVFANTKGRKPLLRSTFEVAILYLACLLCYIETGCYASNYKSLFVSIVILYTIDIGSKAGMTLASIASATVLIGDLLTYKGSDVSQYFQADMILSSIFFFAAYIVGFYSERSDQLVDQLRELANRDGLTGMFNHRHFHERLLELINGDPLDHLFLFIIDIDYFKVYNDTLGHHKGDIVLKKINEIFREELEDETVFRYGGEEFAVLLSGVDVSRAMEIAETLRRKVSDYPFDGEEVMPGHDVTISIGVAEKKAEDSDRDIIERADNALYKAKMFKKNRVELYTSMFDRFEELDKETDDEKMISIRTLLSVINSRDRYTYNHTDRVVHYCEIFATRLGLPEEDKHALLQAAYLHDIGKINIPKEILITEKRLTDEQWEKMRMHPSDGAEIASKIKNMDLVAQIVLQHHERYDGGGYPQGIAGEQIHPLARMLTIADSFDAMTAKRPYQKVRTFEDAFEEIERCAGTQFDPELSKKFVALMIDNYS